MSATLSELLSIKSRHLEDTLHVLQVLAEEYDIERLEAAQQAGRPRRRIGELAVDASVRTSSDGLFGRRPGNARPSTPKETDWSQLATDPATLLKTANREKQKTGGNIGGEFELQHHAQNITAWSLASRPGGGRQARLLIAPAGHGKTFLSQWSAATLAREMLARLDSHPKEEIVFPIWLTARDIARAGGRTFQDRVVAAWQESPAARSLTESQHRVVAQTIARSAPGRRRVMVFIDSLDELGSEEEESFRLSLHDLAVLGDSVCFTTRPQARLLADRPAPLRDVRELELLPLTGLQQEEFVIKVLGEAAGEAFADRLRTDLPHLQRCAEVPLLLRFLCENGVKGSTQASDILRAMIDQIMSRRDWRPVIPMQMEHAARGLARGVLCSAAARLFITSPQSNEFNMRGWQTAWSEVERDPAQQATLRELSITSFFDMIVQTGLVVKGGGEGWFFAHRQLLEFLMAEWLSQLEAAEARRVVRPALGFVEGRQLGCDPAWEPTLDFYAALGGAGHLVSLMDEVTAHEGDDLFRSLLLCQVRWAALGSTTVPRSKRLQLARQVVEAGFGESKDRYRSSFSPEIEIPRPPFHELTTQFYRWIAADTDMRQAAVDALQDRWVKDLKKGWGAGYGHGLGLIGKFSENGNQTAGNAIAACLDLYESHYTGSGHGLPQDCPRILRELLVRWSPPSGLDGHTTQEHTQKCRDLLVDLALSRSAHLEDWLQRLAPECAGEVLNSENAKKFKDRKALEFGFLRVLSGQPDAPRSFLRLAGSWYGFCDNWEHFPRTTAVSQAVAAEWTNRWSLNVRTAWGFARFLLACGGRYGRRYVAKVLEELDSSSSSTVCYSMIMWLAHEPHVEGLKFIDRAFDMPENFGLIDHFEEDPGYRVYQLILGATLYRLPHRRQQVLGWWNTAGVHPKLNGQIRLQILKYLAACPSPEDSGFLQEVIADRSLRRLRIDTCPEESGYAIPVAAVEALWQVDAAQARNLAQQLLKEWMVSEEPWESWTTVNNEFIQASGYYSRQIQVPPAFRLLVVIAEHLGAEALPLIHAMQAQARQQLRAPGRWPFWKRPAAAMLFWFVQKGLNSPAHKFSRHRWQMYFDLCQNSVTTYLASFFLYAELLKVFLEQGPDTPAIVQLRPSGEIDATCHNLATELGGANAFDVRKRAAYESGEGLPGGIIRASESLWKMSLRLKRKVPLPPPAVEARKRWLPDSLRVAEILALMAIGLCTVVTFLLAWHWRVYAEGLPAGAPRGFDTLVSASLPPPHEPMRAVLCSVTLWEWAYRSWLTFVITSFSFLICGGLRYALLFLVVQPCSQGRPAAFARTLGLTVLAWLPLAGLTALMLLFPGFLRDSPLIQVMIGTGLVTLLVGDLRRMLLVSAGWRRRRGWHYAFLVLGLLLAGTACVGGGDHFFDLVDARLKAAAGGGAMAVTAATAGAVPWWPASDLEWLWAGTFFAGTLLFGLLTSMALADEWQDRLRPFLDAQGADHWGSHFYAWWILFGKLTHSRGDSIDDDWFFLLAVLWIVAMKLMVILPILVLATVTWACSALGAALKWLIRKVFSQPTDVGVQE